MTYKILIVSQAEKDLKKLDAVVRKKIKAEIIRYSINPYFHSKKLTSSKIGSYRWRVGKYRVIFDVDKEKIIILRIGHRREIYKK